MTGVRFVYDRRAAGWQIDGRRSVKRGLLAFDVVVIEAVAIRGVRWHATVHVRADTRVDDASVYCSVHCSVRHTRSRLVGRLHRLIRFGDLLGDQPLVLQALARAQSVPRLLLQQTAYELDRRFAYAVEQVIRKVQNALGYV